MQEMFENIKDFILGKNEKPNPSIEHNAKLIKEALRKIETGVFTRYFKKSYFFVIELTLYFLTILFFISGVIVLIEINKYFLFASKSVGFAKFESLESGEVSNIIFTLKIATYILIILPSILSFLWARTYTRARRKFNTLIQVENILERVIFNFTSKRVDEPT